MNENPKTSAFEVAIAALKDGELVKRELWQDEVLFATGALTEDKKEISDERLTFVMGIMGHKSLSSKSSINLLKQSSGEVLNGWVPNQEDMMANDWVTVRSNDIIDQLIISRLNDLLNREDFDTLAEDEEKFAQNVIDIIADAFSCSGLEFERNEDESLLVMRGKFDGLFIVSGATEDKELDEKEPCLYRIVAPAEKDEEGQFLADGGQFLVAGSGNVLSDLVNMQKHCLSEACSKKTFVCTDILINVLTTVKIDEGISMRDIVLLEEEGKCSISNSFTEQYEVDAVSAMRKITEADADPSILGLTGEGKDL